MARKPKYPNPDQIIESFYSAVSDSYRSPGSGDEVGDVPGRKKQELLAEEYEISRIKVRKILITTGDITYPQTQQIQALVKSGMSIGAVAEKMGISISSVNSLLPYSKGVYGLDVSAAADRTQLYRARKQIILELKDAIQAGEWSLKLWRAICLFQNYPFFTAGRKRKIEGEAESGRGSAPGKRFKYSVSKEGGAGGRHYEGEAVPSFGNEMWISTAEGEKKKSISRSTVDRALHTVISLDGHVPGPRALGLPGAGSYLFPVFVRFGLIKSATPDSATTDSATTDSATTDFSTPNSSTEE